VTNLVVQQRKSDMESCLSWL